MPVLRNRLSKSRSGGPRQFAELRDRIMVRASSFDDVGEVRNRLFDFGFESVELDNAPIILGEPESDSTDIIRRISELEDSVKLRQAVDEVSEGDVDDVVDISSVTIRATEKIKRRILSVPGVSNFSFVKSYTDFGPENLRLAPEEMVTVAQDAVGSEKGTMDQLNKKYGLEDAWEMERGDQSIVAVFDTGFAEGIIDKSRIIDTHYHSSVDNVYAPAEGHGTMTAGAAAANKNDGVPFNGTAPDSDVILVRITDSEGQIRSDIISNAWDRLMSMNADKPIVANHSYGTPICSGRPKNSHCNTPEQDLVRRANSGSDITSLYAAGNEAMYCGHRPSGITNGITGTNSLAEVITVGALLFNGREAQKYSSHGRGDCAPIADPKPNVSFALPNKTYYGVEDGWKVKDMSTGLFGSSGGTSHACPSTAGVVALMQSRAMKERGEALQTEELKQILHDTSEVPHASPVNKFGLLFSESGYDARFGHGQVKPVKALEEI